MQDSPTPSLELGGIVQHNRAVWTPPRPEHVYKRALIMGNEEQV